jgi:NAD(P)H dehydrogenase (quinone)
MITIIYSHPSVKSYNHSILSEVKKVLDISEQKYKVIDLYKEKFDPIMSEDDLKNFGRNPSKEIKKYQDIITKSEKLIFIYPTWWNSMPAMMKGFMDKVFQSRYAFRFQGSMPVGLLKGKKALIITTQGGSLLLSDLFLGKRNIKVMKKDILEFCGIKTSYIRFGKVLPSNKNLEKELSRVKFGILNFLNISYKE